MGAHRKPRSRASKAAERARQARCDAADRVLGRRRYMPTGPQPLGPKEDGVARRRRHRDAQVELGNFLYNMKEHGRPRPDWTFRGQRRNLPRLLRERRRATMNAMASVANLYRDHEVVALS